MKNRLPLTVATVVLVVAVWAVSAMACDDAKSKTTASTAKSTTCTAAMAAKCTAAQAAACKGAMGGASAVTASTDSYDHCSGKNTGTATATATAYTRCSGKTAAAASEGCGAKTASASGHCAGMAAGVGNCPHAKGAVAFGSEACTGRGMTNATDGTMSIGCDACSDMARCEQDLRSAGTLMQAVPLKNGMMFVYTASARNHAREVQDVMARRTQRLNTFTSAGDKVTLCPACKALRGAIASGKLTREIVNIEGGCVTLLTSSDPGVVSKLHAMARTSATTSATTARIKS